MSEEKKPDQASKEDSTEKSSDSPENEEIKVSAPAPAEAAGGHTEDDDIQEAEVITTEVTSESKSEYIKSHVVEGSQKVADISKKAAEATGEVLSNSYEKVKDYDPKTSVHVLDKFLNWVRVFCPPEIFDKISDWCAKYGHWGLVVAQVLTGIFFLMRVFTDGFSVLILGAGIVLLLVALQYAAEKFLYAGKKFIESTPSRLNSPAFLDCTALLLEISGLLIFVSLIVKYGLFSVNALIGLAVCCLLEAIALTAVHPSLVNVSVEDDVSAGEEAIGILSFFAKSVLKVVPIAYGAGAFIGALAILGGIGTFLLGNPAVAGMKAISLIVVFAALPLASYVLFIVYHLFIDLLQAILSIPRKLDDMK